MNLSEPIRRVLYGTTPTDLHIHIGEIPIPYVLEPQHIFLVGATGSGKTVVIEGAVNTIRQRPLDRVVILDSDGNLLSRIGRPEDTIFNPFDARSPAWSPTHEVATRGDTENLVYALVPPVAAGGLEEEWAGFARNVLDAVLTQKPGALPSELYRLLFLAGRAELAVLVSNTPARRIFEPGAEKMLSSTLGVLASRVGYLRHLKDPEPGTKVFTFSQWARESPKGARLFFSYKLKQRAALMPLFSAGLALLGTELLSQAPLPQPATADSYRRTWFVGDEWGLLGAIYKMDEVLTNGRRFGVACIMGVQDIHQLHVSYGKSKTGTLLNSMGTWLVMCQNDGESAAYFSRALGDRQVLRTLHSRTNSANKNRSSTESTSQQVCTEQLVLSGEILHLPNLKGFLRLRGHPTLLEVTLTPLQCCSTGQPPFIARQEPAAVACAPEQEIRDAVKLDL